MDTSIGTVIAEKIKDFAEEGIPEVFDRDLSLGRIQPPTRGNLVNVIVGVRRCGKTYRLYQEMRRIVAEGYPQDSILYFNFEDERLKPYEKELLQEVIEVFYARNPRARQEGAFFFFDEIQEVPDWGLFLRRMVDTYKATIYATGSSSKMLSTEVASEFRGRALPRELFPLSFSEFVRYQGHEAPSSNDSASAKCAFSSNMRAHLRYDCGKYLGRGGFVAVQGLEPSDATLLLQEYAIRTVNYDVIERYNISNPLVASSFLSRCLASSGRELSLSKVHGEFRSRGLSTSREMLARLLRYYQEAYLLFPVKEFSRAVSENARSSAKVYAVDPAMFSAFSPSPTRDEGQKLETAVFNKLRRQTNLVRQGGIARLSFEKGSARHEVDFVVGDALLQEAWQLVQVSCSLADAKTRRREVRALEAAMPLYGVNESWIVTLDETETIETATGTIHVVPAWSWLLD